MFGVQKAKEMNIKKLQLESDCLVAIKEITKAQDTFSEWSSFLMEIVNMSTEFELCSFNYVSRRANVMAHNMAKIQWELGEHRIRRNPLPPMFCNPDSVFD